MTHFDDIIAKKGLQVNKSEEYLKFLSEILTLKQITLVQGEAKINDSGWFDFLKKVDMLSKQFKHLEQSNLAAMSAFREKIE